MLYPSRPRTGPAGLVAASPLPSADCTEWAKARDRRSSNLGDKHALYSASTELTLSLPAVAPNQREPAQWAGSLFISVIFALCWFCKRVGDRESNSGLIGVTSANSNQDII